MKWKERNKMEEKQAEPCARVVSTTKRATASLCTVTSTVPSGFTVGLTSGKADNSPDSKRDVGRMKTDILKSG